MTDEIRVSVDEVNLVAGAIEVAGTVPRDMIEPLGLGDMVASVFGAVLPDEEGQPVTPAYRPNRAARRAAARAGRRRG